MTSMEFCKIPPLPWHSMEAIWHNLPWLPWKWSPNTPWKWQWNPWNSMEISETGMAEIPGSCLSHDPVLAEMRGACLSHDPIMAEIPGACLSHDPVMADIPGACLSHNPVMAEIPGHVSAMTQFWLKCQGMSQPHSGSERLQQKSPSMELPQKSRSLECLMPGELLLAVDHVHPPPYITVSFSSN